MAASIKFRWGQNGANGSDRFVQVLQMVGVSSDLTSANAKAPSSLPFHTRKVAGSIPAGTTRRITRSQGYLPLGTCDRSAATPGLSAVIRIYGQPSSPSRAFATRSRSES